MPTIAVGDVHANYAALCDLLDQPRHQVDDRDIVVFLGDYIDRGPASKQCVTAILQFQRDVSAEVACLCGNHEDWFLRTRADHRRHSWLLGMGALDTIQSYSPQAAQVLREAAAEAGLRLYLEPLALPYESFFDTIPEDHLRFFEDLLPYCHTPDCLCVHGGVDPGMPLSDQPRDALIWGVDGFPERYSGTELIVYGHRNNAEVDSTGWPRPQIVGRTIGLDTIAHGVLTAMRLPDRQVFQSARHRVQQSE